MNYIRTILFGLLLCSLFACKKQNSESDQTIQIPKKNYVLSSVGGEVEVYLQSKSAVAVKIEGGEWLRQPTTKATQLNIMTFICDTNFKVEARTASVVFASSDQIFTDTIWVKQQGRDVATAKNIHAFKLYDPISKLTSLCQINGNKISGHSLLPVDLTNLIAEFGFEGKKITIGETEQQSGTTPNDFTKAITYTVWAEDGSSKDYVVEMTNFTGLPILDIVVDNYQPILGKDNYQNAVIKTTAQFFPTDQLYQGATQIKGRGNYTWGLPKKPYRLKLDKNANNLFGMPRSKHFALLACYEDRTLIRNYCGFELSRRFNMAWTPRMEFVELYINHRHQGPYILTEHVRVDPNRVNITSMTSADNTHPNVTGGYLVEMDGYWDALATARFKTPINQTPFVIKDPDEVDVLTPQQLGYISDYFTQAEAALFSNNFGDPDNGYAKFFNIETFVDWYLINELAGNADSNWSSIYFYKERNGKLSMGPVWDMESGFGASRYSYPSNVNAGSNVWIKRLLEDPAFRERVKARWQELRPQIYDMINFIDQMAQKLRFSQKLNGEIWLGQGGNFAAEIDYLKTWYSERLRVFFEPRYGN